MDQKDTESSGGTRYSEGKPSMFWCAPLMGLTEVVKVTEYGSSKYAPFDWDEGQSFSTLYDSAMRHMVNMSAYGMMSTDDESGLLHASHAAWNLLCMLSFVAEGREIELDDTSAPRGHTAESWRELAAEKAARAGIGYDACNTPPRDHVDDEA